MRNDYKTIKLPQSTFDTLLSSAKNERDFLEEKWETSDNQAKKRFYIVQRAIRKLENVLEGKFDGCKYTQR